MMVDLLIVNVASFSINIYFLIFHLDLFARDIRLLKSGLYLLITGDAGGVRGCVHPAISRCQCKGAEQIHPRGCWLCLSNTPLTAKFTSFWGMLIAYVPFLQDSSVCSTHNCLVSCFP